MDADTERLVRSATASVYRSLRALRDDENPDKQFELARIVGAVTIILAAVGLDINDISEVGAQLKQDFKW